METYDQNGSEIQPHRVTSTHGRDHHHLSKHLSFETKKGSAWQVTLTDSAFAKTSKASFQCCRLAWINVLTVTGSQNWRIVATQRERWKAAAHAARLPAAPEAGGAEPHSQSFPESRWRGLRSGCLCWRFGVSVNLEVHSKEKMILREHLLQSDICPKHLVFFSSPMALLTVVLLYASVIVIRFKSTAPNLSHGHTVWLPIVERETRLFQGRFLFGVPNVILQAQGRPSRLKHDSRRLQWSASLS